MNNGNQSPPTRGQSVAPARPVYALRHFPAVQVQIVKFKMSAILSATCLAGYYSSSGADGPFPFLLLTSLFCLVCGAAALNNFQDRGSDARWERTCRRPLPQRQIRPGTVLGEGICLVAAGLAGLLLTEPEGQLAILGIFAVFLYNFSYTPLKKRTSWAILPGALCGMMPLLIGWTAAGGQLYVAEIWALSVIMVVWQLPHFGLLLLHYQKDYLHSDMPSLLKLFSVTQIKRILFVWVTALSVLMSLLPLYRLVLHPWLFGLLLMNAGGLICIFAFTFMRSGFQSYYTLFKYINLSMGLAMILIVMDRFVCL